MRPPSSGADDDGVLGCWSTKQRIAESESPPEGLLVNPEYLSDEYMSKK